MTVVLRALLVVAAMMGGAVAGALGSFAFLETAFGLPYGLLLGVLIGVGVVLCAGLGAGRPTAVAAVLGWLAVVLLLANRRPEGDLVVDGSLSGYAWLFGGTLVLGACAALPYPPRPEGAASRGVPQPVPGGGGLDRSSGGTEAGR